ncbi:hypothetical protein CEXT_287851, partial [Caerostris extrusa]
RRKAFSSEGRSALDSFGFADQVASYFKAGHQASYWPHVLRLIWGNTAQEMFVLNYGNKISITSFAKL